MRPRELTVEERMVWGDCPVCPAKDGEPCYAEMGFQLGQKVGGSRMKTGEGVHLARMRNAPEAVEAVPCRGTLALLLALLLWCVPVAAETTYRISGIAAVSDGDTIRIGEERIRIHGIDAPETAQRCAADGHLYLCGIRATLYLRSIAQGRQVRCVGTERDRYSRLIARCFADSTDLGAAMVLAGHAMAYVKYSSDYVPLETAARSGLSGIWAGEFMAPWDWRKARRAGRRP